MLQPFDQTQFYPKGGFSGYMAAEGRIFIPRSCIAMQKCKLHFFFHGCDVTDTYDIFTNYSGYNEWAFLNNIVVVYPKMSATKLRHEPSQMRSGCFDGYGQTGRDYNLKTGPQMQTVANMIARLVGL